MLSDDEAGHEEAEAGALGQQDQRQLRGLAMHIVLDHHLQAEGGMPEHRPQQHHHEPIGEGLVQPGDHARIVGAQMGQKGRDEPDDQRDQQQRRHPLDPPMGHPFLGGAQAAHPAERRA